MKTWQRVSLILIALAWTSTASAAPQIASAKAYTGPNGIRVQVLRLEQAESQALVRVLGSDTDLDDKVLLYDVSESGSRVDYSTKRGGRDFTALRIESSYGSMSVVLWLPEGKGELALGYDELATQALDAAEVVRLHEKQASDGTLGRYQTFDRSAEMKSNDQALAETATALSGACGAAVAASIDWKGIDDALLKEHAVGSYCGTPLEALKSLCASPSAKKVVARRVRKLRCSFGAKLDLALKGDELQWTTATDAPNQEEFASKWLESHLSAGRGTTLGDQVMLDGTGVCTDGKAHYVVVTPHDTQINQLFVGNGSKVAAVPLPTGLPGTYFFDPRYVNAGANPDFRGVDMRVHSQVEWDKEHGSCKVTCGERALALKTLDRAAAEKYLLGAQLEEPQRYEPHALLRDDAGHYYYVERSAQNEKEFRVFVGAKGALKPQKLKDAISDASGELFVTGAGSLRRASWGAPGAWVTKGTEVPLLELPLAESWSLIYGDLGVYKGAALGTPCDGL